MLFPLAQILFWPSLFASCFIYSFRPNWRVGSSCELTVSSLSWVRHFSCRLPSHPLLTLIITELEFFLGLHVSHGMWDPWGHICCYPYIPKAGHSWWFILDFNREEKDFGRNLIGINMFPLVPPVPAWGKLSLRDCFPKLGPQDLWECTLFYWWIKWSLFSW